VKRAIYTIIRIVGIFLLLSAVDNTFQREGGDFIDNLIEKAIRRTLGIESALCKCEYSFLFTYISYVIKCLSRLRRLRIIKMEFILNKLVNNAFSLEIVIYIKSFIYVTNFLYP